jgi:hypothetical protein
MTELQNGKSRFTACTQFALALQTSTGTAIGPAFTVMKKCSYCGLENPDGAERCTTCQTELAGAGQPQKRPVTATEEQRFWDRMNFRQFALLYLRIQAVWLLWGGLIDLTYVPNYVARSYSGELHLAPAGFHWILRALLHVAAGVALIRYADNFLSWLVRDWIRHQPPSNRPESTVAAPAGADAPKQPR